MKFRIEDDALEMLIAERLDGVDADTFCRIAEATLKMKKGTITPKEDGTFIIDTRNSTGAAEVGITPEVADRYGMTVVL